MHLHGTSIGIHKEIYQVCGTGPKLGLGPDPPGTVEAEEQEIEEEEA